MIADPNMPPSIDAYQTVLHYRFVEKLGEGAMGVVWKTIDTTLDREVAVKVAEGHLAGPLRVKRRGKSCRQLEERAECSLRMIAPEIGDLHARSPLRIEVDPFQTSGRQENGLTVAV